MLDIKLIRQNPDKVKEKLAQKGSDPVLIDELLSLDGDRRKLLQEIETVRHKKGEAEEKLSSADKDDNIIKTLKEVKLFLDFKEKELSDLEEKIDKVTHHLPNLPLDDVPMGKNEQDNIVIKEVGKKPVFKFPAKDYLELGEKLDIIDVKRASKTSGSRFGFLKNQAAILEFALVQFALNKLIKNGFKPIIPPVLIKPEMFKGMGYIDNSDEEMYLLEKDNLYLVGTSEQIIGPMHVDEAFNEKELPCRYISFSSCFRREAGSYGKDTKGILRVHQFDKLEMFVFSKPEESLKEQQLMLKMEEELMKELGIAYRVVRICASELSQPSASSYDIEAWLPGQKVYKETHSNSNCTDFQARRLNIRYRRNNETGYVHTLNGTAFAMGRTIIAILENYQQKDSSIRIPKCLLPYTIGLRVIR